MIQALRFSSLIRGEGSVLPGVGFCGDPLSYEGKAKATGKKGGKGGERKEEKKEKRMRERERKGRRRKRGDLPRKDLLCFFLL